MTRTIRRKRRGADLSGTIVRLVVFAAVFLVLLLLLKEFLTVGKNSFSEKQCQTSLLLTKAISPPSPACFMGTPDVIPLMCNRNFIAVSPTAAVVNGKEVTKLYDASCPAPGFQSAGGSYGQDTLSETEIKERAKNAQKTLQKPQPSAQNVCLQNNVLADEMARCWRTFFNGEQIVLQQLDIPAKNFFTKKDKNIACYICSEVTLKDADVKDLIPYLQNKPTSDGKTSYYDLLANNTKAWCDPDLAREHGSCWDAMQHDDDDGNDHVAVPYTVLPKNRKYAVVFLRRGLGSCDNEKDADTTFTNQYLTNTVQVVPVELLPDLCDKVAG
ncbi:TPA: hypothetical protein HA251_06765 [Candidatus Woesearchaeota archaeon]|nr:hypothetical protein [Candidatus Woesearchaeota archaeon]